MDIKKDINYKKKYYQEHKDTIKETNKKYYKKHKDKILENAKAYRIKNKDIINVKIQCDHCKRFIIARGKNKHNKTEIHKRRGELKQPKRHKNVTQKYKNNASIRSNNFFNYKKIEPSDDSYTLTFL